MRAAVIPAAGLGTRFLPATKAVPKELLPVVDRPALQYVVEEASAAGLTEVVLITSDAKQALLDHFTANRELEAALEASGNASALEQVRAVGSLAHVTTAHQSAPRGLGDAVLCAADAIGDEPFAVLLGDDLIDARDDLLTRMVQVRQQRGGSVIALMRVPRDEVSKYGCASVEPIPEDDSAVIVRGLVEKPAIDDAPSDLVVVGRYVLDPEVFEVLRTTPPGRGGEVQLTDALEVLASRGFDGAGGGVTGVIFTGRRFDTGDKLEYLKAVVQLAVEREDLGPAFQSWLRAFVAGETADPFAHDRGLSADRLVDE